MTHFLVLLLAGLIGVVAGLRALTGPAVVAWAALLDWINLDGTWVQWLGHPITVAVLTVLALGELVTDQLPKTPSRTTAVQFLARLAAGAFSGAVIGTAWGYTFGGLGAGMVGAVLGTLGGFQARTRLAAATGGRDRPLGLAEDVVAVVAGFAIAALTSVV